MSRLTIWLSLVVPPTCTAQPPIETYGNICDAYLVAACPLPTSKPTPARLLATAMAEAYAALQIAASILQVIDIGTRVVKRLHEYHQKSNGLPESFKHINKRLPLFLDALRQTSAAIEYMSDATRKAFVPAVEECLAQIQKLEVRVNEVLPKPNDSGRTRSWKAIISVKNDNEIKQVDRVIRDYMELLAQHQTSTLVLRNMESKSSTKSVI
jgi:hypothetical protein